MARRNPHRMFRVIRFFARLSVPQRTMRVMLTQWEAQAWCSDPEHSSRTCTTAYRRRYTARNGEWFDGWTQE